MKIKEIKKVKAVVELLKGMFPESEVTGCIEKDHLSKPEKPWLVYVSRTDDYFSKKFETTSKIARVKYHIKLSFGCLGEAGQTKIKGGKFKGRDFLSVS